MLFMLLNILPHFLLQNFFSYFLPPRCVLRSKKYGNFYMHWETKKFMTCFIAVLALLRCSGIEPTKSPKAVTPLNHGFTFHIFGYPRPTAVGEY